MNAFMEQRILEEAAYIIKTKATVRATATKFGVSKSTVHRDMIQRLKYVQPQMEEYIRKILDFNKRERNIRGGEATRQKYMKI